MTARRQRSPTQPADEDLHLLDQWIEEVYGLNKLVAAKAAGEHRGPIPRPTSTSTAKDILNRDDVGTIAMIRAYVTKLEQHAKQGVSHEFMHTLANRLFKKQLPFSDDDLIWFAGRAALAKDFWEWPLDGIVTAIERRVESHGMSDALREAAERMQKNVERRAWHKSTREMVPRLNQLTRGTDLVFNVDLGEPWAKRLWKDVDGMAGKQRQRWNRLLAHAQKSTPSSPSGSWMGDARRLVRAVGVDEFVSMLGVWLPLFRRKRTDRPPRDLSEEEKAYWPNEVSIANGLLLKGLIWCCQAVPDQRHRPALELLMRECYRETALGKRFPEGGTACKRCLAKLT